MREMRSMLNLVLVLLLLQSVTADSSFRKRRIKMRFFFLLTDPLSGITSRLFPILSRRLDERTKKKCVVYSTFFGVNWLERAFDKRHYDTDGQEMFDSRTFRRGFSLHDPLSTKE